MDAGMGILPELRSWRPCIVDSSLCIWSSVARNRFLAGSMVFPEVSARFNVFVCDCNLSWREMSRSYVFASSVSVALIVWRRARHRTRTVPYVRGRIYGAVHVPSARFTLTSVCRIASVGGRIHPYNNGRLRQCLRPVRGSGRDSEFSCQEQVEHTNPYWGFTNARLCAYSPLSRCWGNPHIIQTPMWISHPRFGERIARQSRKPEQPHGGPSNIMK